MNKKLIFTTVILFLFGFYAKSFATPSITTSDQFNSKISLDLIEGAKEKKKVTREERQERIKKYRRNSIIGFVSAGAITLIGVHKQNRVPANSLEFPFFGYFAAGLAVATASTAFVVLWFTELWELTKAPKE